jgi:hypothetical protein
MRAPRCCDRAIVAGAEPEVRADVLVLDARIVLQVREGSVGRVVDQVQDIEIRSVQRGPNCTCHDRRIVLIEDYRC